TTTGVGTFGPDFRMNTNGPTTEWIIFNDDAGNDPQIGFITDATSTPTRFTMGVDDSDGLFKMSNSATLETSTVLVLDNSGHWDFQAGNLTTTGDLEADDATFTGTLIVPTIIADTTTLVVNAPSYENKVGIGTATPLKQFHISNASGEAGMMFSRKDTSVDDGNNIGIIRFSGAEDETENDVGVLILEADGDWDASNSPTRFVFQTTTSGKTSDVKMVLDKDGNVGIGTTDPQVELDLVGDLTATGTATVGGLTTRTAME
ncbi:unnamed protein product, partial [marine sediment metagenome]